MKVADIQRLCDVHAAVFDGSISDIHKINDYSATPGPSYPSFLRGE